MRSKTGVRNHRWARALCAGAALWWVTFLCAAEAPTPTAPLPEDYAKVLAPIAGGVGKDGWTVLRKSADTRTVYVSSSSGDDANDGATPESSLKTFARGMALLREGKPDWLLLKRGDQWSEALGTLNFSGRSAAEPIVIGAYGDKGPRPLLKLSEYDRGLSFGGTSAGNVVVTSIHFYDEKGDPRTKDFDSIRVKTGVGVYGLCFGENVLIEDCRFEMLGGMAMMGRIWTPPGQTAPEGNLRNVQVRRCVLFGAWTTKGHCQGGFFSNIDGLLLEENVLDHNGWNTEAGDLPTVFNHNVYITIGCDHVVARGNIVARGSTTGIYCRTNGILEDNVCVDNAPALNLGRIGEFRPGGVTGRVVGNVVFGAPTRTGAKNRRIPNHGIEVGNVNFEGAVVADNILVGTDQVEGSALTISPLGVGAHNVVLSSNTVYNWPRALSWTGSAGEEPAARVYSGIVFQDNLVQVVCAVPRAAELFRGRDAAGTAGMSFSGNVYSCPDTQVLQFGGESETLPQYVQASGGRERVARVAFVDPNRTLATYHRALGREATLEAFLAEAREQSRHNWRDAYTARAVIAYIREGFCPQDSMKAGTGRRLEAVPEIPEQ